MEKATLGQGHELLKLVSQSGIEKDAFQELLESGEFTTMLNKFMASSGKNIIIRLVKEVDYTRTPQNAIKATGREEYLDDSVVKTMPAGGDGVKKDIEVVFFHLGRCVSDDDLAVEYEKRGLKPDPYAVAAVNEADPEFADKHPNGTHWKDAKGKWCFVAFYRDDNGRGVSVDRRGCGWFDVGWWFGGVRK